jgi:uncharacterized protein YdeI (YjbR/CyaY-like superfamily)
MLDWYEMPLGLGAAFSENPEAKRLFASMSEPDRRKVIAAAHNIKSKEEMSAYVQSLLR